MVNYVGYLFIKLKASCLQNLTHLQLSLSLSLSPNNLWFSFWIEFKLVGCDKNIAHTFFFSFLLKKKNHFEPFYNKVEHFYKRGKTIFLTRT